MQGNALSDRDKMPFGKYKGKEMANVPAPYLIYLYEAGVNHPGVKGYILNNLDCLQKENKKAKNYGR